jgi:hypothetical protein
MLSGVRSAVPAASPTGRRRMVVLAASFRSVALDSSTVMMPPLAASPVEVVMVATYFDCWPVEASQPQPFCKGAADGVPVWNTSAMVVRHWLAAKMASETLALIV